jgi:nucleoid-associated protein YgaU
MARGIRRSDSVSRRNLTASDTARRVAFGAAWLVVVGAMVGCRQSAAPPTLPPAPTLPVVAATIGPPPVPTLRPEQRYVVREGDTLSGIAARFGVTEEAILEENELADRDRLFIGQELVIPPAQP